MKFLKPVLTAIGCIVAFQSFAQDDKLTTNDIIGDARLIITSNKNDIRLWAHAPRMLVFGGADVAAQVMVIVDKVDSAVDAPWGPRFFGDVDFAALPEDLGTSQRRVWFRLVEGGPSGREISLKLDEEKEYRTDIVVVVGNRAETAIMDSLWARQSAGSRRAIVEGGKARCFYQTISRGGQRYASHVSIFPSEDRKDELRECLWEEILHTLGPLTDAQGSPFFSFDDRSASLHGIPPDVVQYKRENDLLLLRALYESGAGPGWAPDLALEYLKTLVNQEKP